MTASVETAITEIQDIFPKHQVEVTPLDDGGACVIVHDLPLSDKYVPEKTWIGFIIGFQYPYADVYPHHMDSTVKRKDDQSLGEGFSDVNGWQGRSCIQISRRSNRHAADIDTAAMKLAKVLEWIQSI